MIEYFLPVAIHSGPILFDGVHQYLEFLWKILTRGNEAILGL